MTPEAFFDSTALPSLIAEYGARKGELRPSAAIAEMWGFAVPHDFSQMVDILGSVAVDVKVVRGSFYAFAAEDFLPPTAVSSFTFMLGEWFRRMALLTQTVPLGNNGGGDIWLAEVHPDRSRVFLLDHDEMKLAIIADSISSFAQLVHLQNEVGEPSADEWAPLEGHVRGGRDVGVPAGFRSLAVEAGRDLSDRANTVDELLGCLWYGHEPRAMAAPAGTRADGMMERLLRAFLRCEREELSALLAEARDHAAGVVRAACTHLEAHCGEPDRTKRLRALVPRT